MELRLYAPPDVRRRLRRAHTYHRRGAHPDDHLLHRHVTDPRRPRLVRRINNGDPVAFNNNLGTAVAFDIENLQITYDLADGVTNPANVRMGAADLDGQRALMPTRVRRTRSARSTSAVLGALARCLTRTSQFFRNTL